jgi:hypothetical protein
MDGSLRWMEGYGRESPALGKELWEAGESEGKLTV